MSFFKSKRKDIVRGMDDLAVSPVSSVTVSRSNSPPIPTPSQVNASRHQNLASISTRNRLSNDAKPGAHLGADFGPPPGGPPPAIQPLLHPTKSMEDAAILNILPSYEMYKSTVSRTMTPSHENFKVEPPTYELTPSNSASQLALQSPGPGTPAEPASISNPFGAIFHPQPSFDTQLHPLLAAEAPAAQTLALAQQDNLWENTILANAHKLTNLTNTDNRKSNDLKIKIHFTEQVGQVGVAPVFSDPLAKEFKQGDYIHGFVTIENTSAVPISFEMVYIVFEGCITVLDNANGLVDTKKPLTMYKFLNMVDLFASWTFANIDRLVTDNGDPHDWCNGETDPYDNTVLSIDVNRTFEPNVKYKRFFTFRVPEKLLDDACELHDLTRHQEVPPTIGVPRHNVNTQTTQETASNSEFSFINTGSDIKDFSFVDTSISYSVDARIIGSASEFNYKGTGSNTTPDEYILAKETSVPIRVVSLLNPERALELYVNRDESKLFYRAFVDCVKNKLKLGRDILQLRGESGTQTPLSGTTTGIASPMHLTPMNSIDHNSLSATSSSQFVKIRQLYEVEGEVKKLKVPRKSVNEEQYQSFLSYKKKSLTGTVKSSGILSVSTPKAEYRIAYQPPARFRHQYPNIDSRSNTHVKIPIEIQFLNESLGSKAGFPEFKEVTTELTVFTVKSKKHTIPVEFYHDLLFHDQEVEGSKRMGADNFDSIVVKKFQSYLHQMTDLIKKNGHEVFLVENRLFNDIKAMAFLSTKYIHLTVDDTQISTIGSQGTGSIASSTGAGLHSSLASVSWTAGEGANIFELQGYTLHYKRFDLELDLLSAQFKAGGSKPGERFCLLPDFQSCLITRMYYLKLGFKTTTNQILTVNVPLIVENLD